MEFKAELMYEAPGYFDYEVTKSQSVYTDRVIVAEKADKIFLLTTFDVGEVPQAYEEYVKSLTDLDYEISINYIPVFFGCDYDDVVRIMDEFAKKIRGDYAE